MQLEQKDLKEFIQIWEEEFNEVLSQDDARQHASLLFKLYSALLVPQGQERSGSGDG